MAEVYDGYMGKESGPSEVACAMCGLRAPAHSMIEAFRADRLDPDFLHPACWHNRGPKRPPAPVRPVSRDVKADHGASSHKTVAEAVARAAKVRLYLGIETNIEPRDSNEPGPFTVFPDSPLVPGFDKVKCKNPFDR